MRQGKRFVFASMPIGAAERLFQAEFFEYHHKRLDKPLLRCAEYSVPSHLPIAFISNTVRLPRHPERPHFSASDSLAATPATLLQQLNISQSSVPSHPSGKNLQAVASFLGQYYDPHDYAQMRSMFHLPPQPVNRTVGVNPYKGNIGVEASLDIQYLSGVASGIETWVW